MKAAFRKSSSPPKSARKIWNGSPDSVTAVTSKERDLIGIETFQDITNFTPGLAYNTYLDRAFIRGIGRETNNLATQPGVATYSDGQFNTSVVAASGDSLFLDRVEVLRGPQGTLYGRNSIGGTINSISKRPTADWEAEVRANFGNYGRAQFRRHGVRSHQRYHASSALPAIAILKMTAIFETFITAIRPADTATTSTGKGSWNGTSRPMSKAG